MRSIKAKASNVKTKLDIATDNDVSVGEEKESIEKIVAEKYIRLLNPQSCCSPCSMVAMINALRFPSTRNKS